MAINLTALYPSQVATDAAYPHGKAQNESSPGANDGTPFEAALVNDLLGLQQALLTEAGIAPSGDPDEVGASQYLQAVQKLVERGAHAIALSNWTRQTAGGSNPTLEAAAWGAAWGGGSEQFVAVGEGGEIQTSPDGVTWTQQSAALGYAGDFHGLCWSGSQYVAVGSLAVIQTSPDGDTWTDRPSTGGFSGAFRAVAWSGSQFLAVGDEREIQGSPDGQTWTQQRPPGGFSGAFLAVVWTGSQFVVVGQDGEIQTSPDGVTWTEQNAAAGTTAWFTGIAWSGSLLVAVGDGEIQTSPDGVTWTRQNPAPGGASTSYSDVLWTGSHFVLVGAYGEVQTSPDGETWTRRPIDDDSGFRGVAIGASRCVAVGSYGHIQTSLRGL